MSGKLLPAVCILSFVCAAGAGEPAGPAKKKLRPKPIEVRKPFDALAAGGYSERLAAFSALLPRAGELAADAKGEVERLRALPEGGSEVGRRLLRFVTGALDDLVAEAEMAKTWKKGLPEAAGKAGGKQVDLTCRDKPIAKVLKAASAGWGLTIELSPAARRMNASLDVDLDGAPTLKQFLDWLTGSQNLTAGHVGGKIVLVPPASLKLARNISEKKAGGA